MKISIYAHHPYKKQFIIDGKIVHRWNLSMMMSTMVMLANDGIHDINEHVTRYILKKHQSSIECTPMSSTPSPMFNYLISFNSYGPNITATTFDPNHMTIINEKQTLSEKQVLPIVKCWWCHPNTCMASMAIHFFSTSDVCDQFVIAKMNINYERNKMKSTNMKLIKDLRVISNEEFKHM